MAYALMIPFMVLGIALAIVPLVIAMNMDRPKVQHDEFAGWEDWSAPSLVLPENLESETRELESVGS